MPANLENSAVATGLEKVSSNPKERQCQKCSNCCTITLNSHASKVMLKILQARLQQYMNQQLPDVQAGKLGLIEKRQRSQKSNCQNPLDHRKSKRFQKNIYFCFTDYAKAFNSVNHNKLWKILKGMGTPDHLTCLPPEKPVCRSRSNS